MLLFFDIVALVFVRSLLGWTMDAQALSVKIPGDFRTAGPLSAPGEPASLVFWVATIIGLLVTGCYSRHRGLNTPVRLATASFLAGAAAAVPVAAVVGMQVAIAQLSLVAGAAWLTLLGIRGLSERFLGHVWPQEKGAAAAVLVGPADAHQSRPAEAVAAAGGDYRIAAHLGAMELSSRDIASLTRTIRESVEQHDAEAVVVTAGLSDAQLRAIVRSALDSSYIVLVPPRAVEVEGVRPRLVWHRDHPFLEFATPGLQVAALCTKRITDVLGASILLILAFPLMLIVAIGVRLDSSGAAIFSQSRAGLGGRRFRMLKFRTMRTSAEEEKKNLAHLNHTGDVRLFKIPADPRVTRFGRFLRRWSLDELPQLWNVLRGDMSLVGPRPFFESDFEAYEEHHFRRLDTKPGITGLWQVSGRSDVVKFEDVVFLDWQYIEQWSFWLDVSILLRTVPSVFRRRGAY